MALSNNLPLEDGVVCHQPADISHQPILKKRGFSSCRQLAT
ncbi:hypothetical protein YPPY13_0292 [Yersinia pestis PY-13]|nr:hypothetical protein YPPY01_0212 [Yersinia pestis PY-01]EIR39186.1 hypothetical protein YPPY10_0302 [Yersinia pestis PY-10]EIR39606.1 hypothetical protein YPPY12_0468 [Yersinia pestis PY-12]EIR52455.1 hypothetical protein YPPY13_0292 [Yersinia pestis PY-13]EIR66304.1 hypothetical protein YPPY16_0316 [Yersinia pestis PY-16]EIR80545.1 hypothetical protein YPPY29_0186 [Yersinia pestis PY-29]EIR95866.1 hypothetical protein YPPY36_0384 [Yersinia pestis PY-36]EIR97484.1 hypothetical protein YPP